MPYLVASTAFRRGEELKKELDIDAAELSRRISTGEFGPSFMRLGGDYLLPAEGVSDIEFSFATDYLMAERALGGPNAPPVRGSEDFGAPAGTPIEVVLPGDGRPGSAPECKAWLLGRTLYFGSPPSAASAAKS